MDTTKRKVLRRLFTIDAKHLEDLISMKGDKIEIKARFEALKIKHEEINALNTSYLQEIMTDEKVSEEKIEEEFVKCGEYNLRFFKIKELFINEVENLNSESSCSAGIKTQLKLPKIELVKFDGDLRNWIGFWGQFAKIHNDNSIPLEDKFEYLRLTMKPGSPAQKLVEGFPPSKENYMKAIELLKSRYGKDDFLIEFYVRELLSLVLQKGKNIPIAQLYDKLESQLRALDSLGVTKEKYTAMLFPLVESSIPENIFKIWERHRVTKNASTKKPDDCLCELLEFLKMEVEGEELLKLRYNSFETSEYKSNCRTINKNKMSNNLPSAAALVSTNNNNYPNKEVVCIFCNKSTHSSQDCAATIDSSLEERQLAVKKRGACFCCLKRGHISSKCKVFVKCAVCKGKHYPILCSELLAKREENSSPKENQTCETTMFTNSQNATTVTYLQTLVVNVINENVIRKVRILCDSGSQRSYISKGCAKELELKPTGAVYTQQELFGGSKTALKSHFTYKLSLMSLDNNFKCEVNVLDQDCICSCVPKIEDASLYKCLKEKGIYLSDFSNSEDDPFDIQILLGADAWSQIITTECCQINGNLVAIKTKLGWSIIGTSENNKSILSNILVALFCAKDISMLWDLECLGIKESGVKTKQDERDLKVCKFFEETVRRDNTGRYVVKLPWIEGCPPLENNIEEAERRLHATTRKLNQVGKYADYDSVIQDWLNKGIIEPVENEEHGSYKFYLPHRGVFKESSTTPVRPVFDASAVDKNGHSLNEFLEKGPNLIEEIPLILLNFRQYLVGLSADIEKAFLRIGIDEVDRDVLRFLWWQNDQIAIFRHCRVVFGVSCSPFLLAACINNLLEHAPDHLTKTAKELSRSFYVDNCLTGVHNADELDTFISESKELMSLAGFNLRGWVTNASNETVENVLGLRWYCATDELGCCVSPINCLENSLTKRTLLSITQKIFDPIGITAPVTLLPKILLQRTWSLKLGWDEVLPNDIHSEFFKWVKQLNYLEQCKLPRHVIANNSSTLHVFCDASQIAFSCCVFLRTESEGKVYVRLLIAKSRIAPSKILTLPRLELMATVIGARLCFFIRKGLKEDNLETYFWSDSTITLAWITNQGPWSIFIENRVKEIRKLSKLEQWNHVPGNKNPADLLSRGCQPKQLLKSRWWEGPEWLYDVPESWPSNIPVPELEEVEKEKRKTNVCAESTETELITTYLANRFSSYTKIVRTIAWMLRFKRKSSNGSRPSCIAGEEFSKAEKLLFRCIQSESFTGEGKNTLKTLQAYKDDQGILRMKSRVTDDEDTEEYTYPVILPSKHPLVEKMIEHKHKFHKHAGTLALLTILREKVWILRGRRTVGSIVSKCMVCKRHRIRSLKVPIPPLPGDRTKISSTFQITGVDLAGPLFTRSKQKCWIVIFTCAVYRAVHLELIQSLSSSAFIQALRRFIARRGRISVIYSDNGTNFVGVNTALKQLDWSDIQKECSLQSIQWRFNPPTAPWWGGFWERLIRILKDLLKKNLGRASLNYEELVTLLCECESIMNNRPLTYLSEEPNELCVLKPSMFLQSLPGNDVTDIDHIESTSLVRRLNYLQTIREKLRMRFKREYLGLLRSPKNQNTDTVKIGDIALIGSDNKRRLDWPIGKIIEIFPGKDNINRLVRVTTAKGCQLRPIQRLYPLEINCKTENSFEEREPLLKRSKNLKMNKTEDTELQPVAKNPVKTRCGRVMRAKERLDL